MYMYHYNSGVLLDLKGERIVARLAAATGMVKNGNSREVSQSHIRV
jgi:hypothetical protein